MGCILVLRLFPENIAFASIMIMTFADPISHLIGSSLGKRDNPFDNKKKIEGNIAGFLVGGLAAMVFVPVFQAVTGAAFAMVFESISLQVSGERVDDNLLVPLIAGTFMYLAITYL